MWLFSPTQRLGRGRRGRCAFTRRVVSGSPSRSVSGRGRRGWKRWRSAPRDWMNPSAPPEVHRVGFLRLGGSSDIHGVLWPDPLLTPAPFEAPPNETQAVWLTYAVPESASPGLHYGKVEVASKKGRTWGVDVTIEVFDFVLPETPTLQAVFPLCRRAVRDVYGIDDTDLEAWKPIYGAFAGYRLALGLWDGGDLVRIQTSGEADATALKEHLAYIVSTAHMSAAPLGPGLEGLAAFPRTSPGDCPGSAPMLPGGYGRLS